MVTPSPPSYTKTITLIFVKACFNPGSSFVCKSALLLSFLEQCFMIMDYCGLKVVNDNHQTCLHIFTLCLTSLTQSIFPLSSRESACGGSTPELRSSVGLKKPGGLINFNSKAAVDCGPTVSGPEAGVCVCLFWRQGVCTCMKFFKWYITPTRPCYSDLQCHYSDQPAKTNNRSAATNGPPQTHTHTNIPHLCIVVTSWYRHFAYRGCVVGGACPPANT